ncbi:hypothetical protein MTO96_008667 [Rhipicephalus appendiculatus]
MAFFFGLPDWVVFLVTAFVLLYLYITRNRNYWAKQNVPHENLEEPEIWETLRVLRRNQASPDGCGAGTGETSACQRISIYCQTDWK